MKKYQQNPVDLTLLSEYAGYMSEYADAISQMEKMGNEDLSSEELKYYLEVNGRITQMLLDAAG
jgi:uncharacterized protein (UPF0297 family)